MWTEHDEQRTRIIVNQNLEVVATGSNIREFSKIYWDFISHLEETQTEFTYHQYLRIIRDMFPYTEYI